MPFRGRSPCVPTAPNPHSNQSSPRRSAAAGGHASAPVTTQLTTYNQLVWGSAPGSKTIDDVTRTLETGKVAWHRALSSQDQMPERPQPCPLGEFPEQPRRGSSHQQWHRETT